jgi:alpha-amylase/alpha-mannosidase (GH57 family)
MKNIAVGFLWHLHQPFYKNPLTDSYLLPWVRMHSIRGYYDMIALLEEFPEISCTFNLVPVLLTQILDYTENGLRDTDFILSQKSPSELSFEEKKAILSRFFMGNPHTLIAPFPRYLNLLEKRGPLRRSSDLDAAVKAFSDQDILDLQVLFNLTWIGFMARKDRNVQDLIKKGRSYTEADKAFLLHYHIEVMKRIIPLYRKASQSGRIELTTSPFYHPISPLVMNVGYALRSMDTPLPAEAFSYPEDLGRQMADAVSFHAKLFGGPPKGMWPSEGSVCPEMVELLEANGIEWIASDEDILFASLHQSRTGTKLYRPYRVEFGPSAVSMFFRDRPLSDNIGFVYSKNPPAQAAENLMYHLRNIARAAKAYDFNPFVSIILDGENPWEHYQDGGEGFLRSLYGALSSAAEVRTSGFSDFLRDNPPKTSLANLYTGSWINRNFGIWIGHEEDRRAWELLSRTRKYVEAKGEAAHPLAWEEILIAEGSDWFWWYGEDFSSENDEDFDNLFRTHLSNCYRLHGDLPPKELSQSVITHHEIAPVKQPAGFVSPTVDGKVTHYYEWLKSGCYIPPNTSTSMYRQRSMVSRIHYGFDREYLFMRVDFASTPKNATITLHIVSPGEFTLSSPLRSGTMTVYGLVEGARQKMAELSSIAFDAILELKVPFSVLHAAPLQRMRFFLSVQEEDLEIERHPSTGVLSFSVPDDKFERILWHV